MVHDLLIVGSGPVGTALALALRERGLDIALVDARGRGASVGDPRVLALSRGSCQTLQRLGAWQELDATPIRRIHVSQQGGFGRTLIDAKEVGVDALGQVVRAGELAGALDRALGNEGLTWIEGGRVAKITAGDDDVVVTLDGERPGAVRARLVACAEGAIDESAPGVRSRDYGQHAVITLATSERPHDHQAFERFTTGGPLALLPFGQRYAVVHTAPPDEAERLADLDDAAYIAEVERRLDEAGAKRLQPGEDDPVGQRQDEDGVTDDHRDQRPREIHLPEEDQKRQAGDDRRHQERQEDDQLEDFAETRAAAVIVEGERRPEDQREDDRDAADQQ